jgi:hypothetical protein
MENDIFEDDKFKINVSKDDLKNPAITRSMSQIQKTNKDIEFELGGKSDAKGMGASMSSMMEQDAIIEPKDPETLRYLSNVKDSNTGDVSKPFNIGDKQYQLVRGINSAKDVVMGVYCFDDLNENNENIIHTMEYFDQNIAKPMKEAMVGQDIQVVPEDKEANQVEDKRSLMDYINLTDIDPSFKHFFVNINTGEVVAMFKTNRDMIKSGRGLGSDEDYMDVKGLKRFRFGDYFKPSINEIETDGTNVPKLQADVTKLANLIKTKFSIYLAKLDKPIEQAQFLTAMAKEIGVPLGKLSTIINSYKDIAAGDTEPQVTTERRVVTKAQLEENLIKKISK